MIKTLFVFGTRPEAIKLAPVIKQMQQMLGDFLPRICVTAQHRQMLDEVLHIFDIQPDIDLNLMQPGQSLSHLTARIFDALDPVMVQEKPDWVLVQGDTTTVMAASLVAFYHRVNVGHVEAGLRTDDKFQPFPEEVNRRMVSVVADLHFAPTGQARQNLLREGVPDRQVLVTGNTVIDALHFTIQQPYIFSEGPLSGLPEGKRIILVTAHRRENFGQPLRDICQALGEIASHYPQDVHLVYPVHLNPNVQDTVYPLLSDYPNITLLPPLDYASLVNLINRSYLILTDSGGLQEEGPSLGKPVLVLRNTTERPEAVSAGTALLVGTDADRIVQEASRLLDDPAVYAQMANAINPFGDGHASERICQALIQASKGV